MSLEYSTDRKIFKFEFWDKFSTSKPTISFLKDTSKIDSIILIDPGNAYYIKSTAALQIAKHLSGGYRLLSNFLFLPESFRNLVYDFIAKNRYKWFGKKPKVDKKLISKLMKL